MEKYIYITTLALCLSACAKVADKQNEQQAMPVRTVVVAPQTGTAVSRYVGSIEPANETPLSSQTPGRVVSVEVKNGQRVRKGQTILQIDETQARNAFETAEASLKQAQDGYDRVRKVHGKGVVSDQKMVEIESQYAQAKSLYAAAKRHLDECTLIAPCDGVVSGLNISQGQNIVPDVTVCKLLDVSGFSVRFTVPEAEIVALQERGEVECAALDTVLPIVVTEKGVAANALTHTYDVKAKIQGGTNILRTGMVAIVRLHSSSAEAVIIPAKCILLKPEGPTVWLKKGNKAVRREITVGGYEADGVRVLSGLQPGDTLITDGYQKLYNNCTIIENK